MMKNINVTVTETTLTNMISAIIDFKLRSDKPAERFEGKVILFEHDGIKITDWLMDETDSIIVEPSYYAQSIVNEFNNLIF